MVSSVATLKLEISARKSAENSTCLHLDIFNINTGKSQGNESVLVPTPKKQIFFGF